MCSICPLKRVGEVFTYCNCFMRIESSRARLLPSTGARSMGTSIVNSYCLTLNCTRRGTAVRFCMLHTRKESDGNRNERRFERRLQCAGRLAKAHTYFPMHVALQWPRCLVGAEGVYLLICCRAATHTFLWFAIGYGVTVTCLHLLHCHRRKKKVIVLTSNATNLLSSLHLRSFEMHFSIVASQTRRVCHCAFSPAYCTPLRASIPRAGHLASCLACRLRYARAYMHCVTGRAARSLLCKGRERKVAI